ncbi:MAG: glycogen debranching enzyme GlgX, partial [Candidatus Sericytochromatia bacterium]
NEKHNEANQEQNRDGESHNLSWNCGVEGPTDDPEVLALRARQMRNLMATLLFSQGVPMICAGDEFGRTQGGNNNAYCQDNRISWLDWRLSPAQEAFLAFTRRCLAIVKAQPVLHRRKFYRGIARRGQTAKDITWYEPTGQEMTDKAWNQHFVRCLGVKLAGDMIDETDDRGEPIAGDTLLLLINAHHEPLPFTLPPARPGSAWEVLVDTFVPDGQSRSFQVGQPFEIAGRSLTLLRAAQDHA